jgi:hypothetical protein
MTQPTLIEHRFVDSAPDDLQEGVLYVSIPYATALHLCPCGCGSEIVTPISRKGWSLTFDGASVTLHPSVGNWNYPCRSHYWIRRDRIEWAKDHSLYHPDWDQRPADSRGPTVVHQQRQDHTATEVGWVRRLTAAVTRWLTRSGAGS